MNKYFWNFNEHEEVWQNSCPTIEDCIEEAKWEKEEIKYVKKFYGIIEFEGISIEEATAFRRFLDTNNIKFKVNKSEVK